MDDRLSQISDLIEDGYTLLLHRDHVGTCSAELSRGWLFRKRVRIGLSRPEFEDAKRLLGDAEVEKRRVKIRK